jgi:hypothetical protein
MSLPTKGGDPDILRVGSLVATGAPAIPQGALAKGKVPNMLPPHLQQYTNLIDFLVELLVEEAEQEAESARPPKAAGESEETRAGGSGDPPST